VARAAPGGIIGAMGRHITCRILLALFLVAGLARAADDSKEALVLKVDGKEVSVPLQGAGSYAAEDEDKADSFALMGVPVHLQGEFDVNSDGKLDGKDRLPRDKDGEIKPASLINKTVMLESTSEKDDTLGNHIEVPGLGRCAILKGSTLTVTKYKKNGTQHYRFFGTVSVRLKTEKGQQKTVQGRFEAVTGED
jgi:hypothetical protein